ncbi:hypothetical protein Gotur_032828, partial [Gossypium turneri]
WWRRGTKHQQRNKELAPAEEQRTSTGRRTKNQHQQRIKEAAEEQRTSDERRDESKKNQFVCVAKKVKEHLRSTFWPEKQKFSAFSSAQKYFKKVSLLTPNEVCSSLLF